MYRKSFLLIGDQKELSGQRLGVARTKNFPAPRQVDSFDSTVEVVALSVPRDRDSDSMALALGGFSVPHSKE